MRKTTPILTSLLLIASAAGCTKDRTEIVLGMATDLTAPAPLSSVTMQIYSVPDGVPLGSQTFPVSGQIGQPYELPATYAVYSAGGSADRFRALLTATDATGATLVVRSAVMNLVPGKTLFARLGVVSACQGTAGSCGAGQTCIEGQCALEDIDSAQLPAYTSGLEKQVECSSATNFVDTSTKQPLAIAGTSCGVGTCLEGVCLTPPEDDGGADATGVIRQRSDSGTVDAAGAEHSGTGGANGLAGSAGRAGANGGGGTTGTGGAPLGSPVLVTSASGAYWTTGTLTTSTATATVTVNDSTVKQNWEGFGGTFNEMGWSYIAMLSASDQAKVMDLLFGSDAAHFAIGRIPVGASDYAISRYTDDETSGDTSLSSFSIAEDMKYLIPYVKAAQAVNSSLRFWASPWTPPTWMKTFTNSDSNGTACKLVGSTPFDGGCMTAGTNNQNFTTLANYLANWVSAYNGQGINIDTISPQNEPNYAQGYPSCLWNTADYNSFMKGALATAFPSAGGTRIMLGTMSNGDNGATSFDLEVVQAVEADSTTKVIPKVMGLQWGMLDFYEGLTSGIGPSTFMTGSLPAWATEHKGGNYPWITNTTTANPATGTNFPAYVEPAPNDLAYGVESWAYIRNAISKGGVTAYNASNMVLDTGGKGNDTTRQWSQNALLVVNTSSKTLTVTPAYYVFRHCSQYVQVGAQVVATTGGDAVAFKNPDGSIVTVMYNSGSATTYTLAVGGQKLQFMMPANGWATVDVP